MYTAHHIDWTKPSGGGICPDRDVELLTAVYSVLKWQKHNGRVVLHTDTQGLAGYKALGILDLWDDVETGILDHFDFSGINYKSFWAAGKFAVLAHIDLPGFLMDLDMVVMGGLEATSFDSSCDISFHNSKNIFIPGLYKDYCDKKDLCVPEGYSFPLGLDWNAPSSSCNFYYINNSDLRDKYVGEAFRFMRGNPTNHKIKEMIFIEQRFLRMLARKGNYTVNRMLNSGRSHHTLDYWQLIDPDCAVDIATDRFLVHLGASVKHLYESKRDTWCRHLLTRLYDEFPDVFGRLCGIGLLEKYVGGYV